MDLLGNPRDFCKLISLSQTAFTPAIKSNSEKKGDGHA